MPSAYPRCVVSQRQNAGRTPARAHHGPTPLPLTSGCHFGAWAAPERTCPPFRTLCPGRSGLRHPEVSRGRFLRSDTFVLLPPLSPACPPDQPTAPAPLPPTPLRGLWPAPAGQPGRVRGGAPCPLAQPPARRPPQPRSLCGPRPPHLPRVPPPHTPPVASSAPSPFPLPSFPGPSVPGSQASSSPPLFALVLSLLSSPSRLHSFACSLTLSLSRLPPSLSPTSLFQLRTGGSSGQFPHRSASGEQTAPLR